MMARASKYAIGPSLPVNREGPKAKEYRISAIRASSRILTDRRRKCRRCAGVLRGAEIVRQDGLCSACGRFSPVPEEA